MQKLKNFPFAKSPTGASSVMNLTTEVVGFALSAFFILLLLAKLIHGKIHATESTSVSQTQMTSGSEREYPINGLKPDVLATLPMMEYNSDTFHSREDAQCSICLEQYKDKELLRTLPRCGHNFHQTCIEIWFRKQSTCPVCRLSLHDSLKAKHMESSTLSEAV